MANVAIYYIEVCSLSRSFWLLATRNNTYSNNEEKKRFFLPPLLSPLHMALPT
mgnify:FL=1